MADATYRNFRQQDAWRWQIPVLLLAALLAWYWVSADEDRQTLAYSEFKTAVRDGRVSEVTMQGQRLTGTLQPADDAAEDAAAQPFATTLLPVDDPALTPLLEEHDVTVRAEPEGEGWWRWALILLLPWLLLLALMWAASRRMQQGMTGGLQSFARSQAKRFRRSESQVSFDDVAGLESAKRDLTEIVGFLKEPETYRRLGAEVPKGTLLMGPPGTGKTLLARAVAGEADVPFYSISGSEFIEMFVGVGASRVRDMFKKAKQDAPAIIFIDEIDSIGRARGTGIGGGHDEREQTLNQILGEMDGFEAHEAVMVLAATNRPDVLDPALLRPGRFDRKVTLDLPDRKARRAILDIHVREVPLADDVDLDRMAAITVGFSGADVENLVNEAALLAGRDRKDEVDMASFLGARDKVALGGKRELSMTEREKWLIACHEAGHAMAASRLKHADPPDKVTIVPRGRALGATEQVPEEDWNNLTEPYLRDRLGVMLGGRAAEQVMFDQLSSGAASDLEQATRLARRMITQWGMSDSLGPAVFSTDDSQVFLGQEMARPRDFSEHTARLIDDEILALVRDVAGEVRELLEAESKALRSLAETLFEEETLERDRIDAILEKASEAA